MLSFLALPKIHFRLRKATVSKTFFNMEIQDNQNDIWSETESNGSARVGHSGLLSGPLVAGANTSKRSSKKSARFKEEEITLVVRDDSASVHDIKGDDQETAYLASQQERNPNSFGTQLSFRLSQVSQGLKRMASSKRLDKVDRTESGASRALRGLKFMTKIVGSEGWSEIETRFEELAANGALPRSRFGQCIEFGFPMRAGMKESSEFAGQLFDALARRRGVTSSSINKAELHKFWVQLTDQSFDARLQTFFDMYGHLSFKFQSS
ncbi:hypothetical protein Tsubulata_040749 [Turnera subulata]|uniref:NADPH oxidase Respiratory burst domain-containing protein n=1 Tax=Turnera subulata TaxID=218843 RepID=A0A9Q0FX69_9ROSI|nr:hypothetical protein Tsubulata_040749 [Turnera subulata]